MSKFSLRTPIQDRRDIEYVTDQQVRSIPTPDAHDVVSTASTGTAREDTMVTENHCDTPLAPPAAENQGLAAPEPPTWAAPALLLSILMLGLDLVALIPLGAWMRDYGIGLVCSVYLVHVLASTALAAWTVTRLPVLALDTDLPD
ncbi:hypothetical protein ACFWUP_15070 [Nocardia sp. NPDC058658]|uniref:hypothetical protein n=1 Tax=Nocardia sp. NPDC058658 TaxID=3346580 RepID=UPI00364C7621